MSVYHLVGTNECVPLVGKGWHISKVIFTKNHYRKTIKLINLYNVSNERAKIIFFLVSPILASDIPIALKMNAILYKR